MTIKHKTILFFINHVLLKTNNVTYIKHLKYCTLYNLAIVNINHITFVVYTIINIIIMTTSDGGRF